MLRDGIVQPVMEEYRMHVYVSQQMLLLQYHVYVRLHYNSHLLPKQFLFVRSSLKMEPIIDADDLGQLQGSIEEAPVDVDGAGSEVVDEWEVIGDDDGDGFEVISYDGDDPLSLPMNQQSASSSDRLPLAAKPQSLLDAYVQRMMSPNLHQVQLCHMHTHRSLLESPAPPQEAWSTMEQAWSCCMERFVNKWWPNVVLHGCGGHQPDYDELLEFASASKHHWTSFQEEQRIMRTNYLFMSLCNHSVTWAIELDKVLTSRLKLPFGKIPTMEQVMGMAQMVMFMEDDDSGSE